MEPQYNRDLDVWVAVTCANWTPIRPGAVFDIEGSCLGRDGNGSVGIVPYYSTDPTAALQITEKLASIGFRFEVQVQMKQQVLIVTVKVIENQRSSFTSSANTISKALSLAAFQVGREINRRRNHDSDRKAQYSRSDNG